MSGKSRIGTEHVKNVLNQISSTDINCNDNAKKILKLAQSRYNEAILITENLKKKEAGFLTELDQYVTSLSPDTVSIGLDDLLKIFNWKNTRGVFRPNINLINKNSDESVRAISKSAFAKIRENKWEKGLDELEKLSGVGPATATCFFAMDKENIPFMCDEILEAVTGQRDYKRKSYLEMRKELVAKAALVDMNASDLCQSLWAHSVLNQVDSNTSEVEDTKKKGDGKKRKRS